jgi:hypothetical protein
VFGVVAGPNHPQVGTPARVEARNPSCRTVTAYVCWLRRLAKRCFFVELRGSADKTGSKPTEHLPE